MGITIIGLGPGDGRYLTREAWQALSQADRVMVRTVRHPAVAELPDDLEVVSFDYVYESSASFEEVYERIVEIVLDMGQSARVDDSELYYAVPGHPLVGEWTVTTILERAASVGLSVRIVDGLSFLEPTLSALGVDGFEGLQLFDALDIAGYNHPPLNCDQPALLGQVYDRMVAGELKISLMALYPDDHEVVLVHEAGTASQTVERLELYQIDRSDRIGHMTSLYVPPLPYSGSLASLAEVVAYLRGPKGCPWDQEQTSQSLRAGLLEEASEVLQAIDDQDVDALREEIGDIFYHLIMQVQIATEQESFRLNEVIGDIIRKLVRRHPHVWGDEAAANSAEVIRKWEAIKELENQQKPKVESVLSSIPMALPALARAQKMQERVAKVGFDWPDIAGVESKIAEELGEISSATSQTERQMELGDLLFALVNWLRWLEVDAESTLRDANRRFERRFRHVESLAQARSINLADLSIDELESLWQEAKATLESGKRTQGAPEGQEEGYD